MADRRTRVVGRKAEPELPAEPVDETDLEPTDDLDEESAEAGEPDEFDETSAEEEPEEEEEAEEEEAEEEDRRRARGRERRAAAAAAGGGGFLGSRRLLGRGRVAGADEGTGRVGTSIRAVPAESRVRITDYVSAAYAIIAAVGLIGVLIFSLTFAPGGMFSPKKTLAPIVQPTQSINVVPQNTPSASPSASAPASPSESPSATPAPSAS